MSSLHLSLDGHASLERSNEGTADSSLTHSFDSSLDQDVLERVATISLSQYEQGETFNESEGDSSQEATELASNLVSAPPSPTSGSITSFGFESNSSSGPLSSPSPQPSLYSLTDSMKEQIIRWEYGRAVNAHSDVYKLAADEEEAERLDKQYHIYKFVFGDYVPPFREILKENDDPLRRKACLDIGCGSGAWILEVATAFPQVDCTAVDLVPLPAIVPSLIEKTEIPSNLRFEIDDVSLGLEHFAGDFDVVHVQHISSGIKDYYRLINDAALALRPRGLADFTEANWRAYNIDKQPIISTNSEVWGSFEPPEGWTGTGMARSGISPVRRTPKANASEPTPYVARFLTLVRQTALRRGSHVDAAALLHRWISEHPAYENVAYREAWLPIGNWLDNADVQKHPSIRSLAEEELGRLRWIGQKSGENVLSFMGAARPLLLSTGVPDALVNEITAKASREIREARFPLYLRAQNVYARRKEKRQDAFHLFSR